MRSCWGFVLFGHLPKVRHNRFGKGWNRVLRRLDGDLESILPSGIGRNWPNTAYSRVAEQA